MTVAGSIGGGFDPGSPELICHDETVFLLILNLAIGSDCEGLQTDSRSGRYAKHPSSSSATIREFSNTDAVEFTASSGILLDLW
jgi:hypothetical protein